MVSLSSDVMGCLSYGPSFIYLNCSRLARCSLHAALVWVPGRTLAAYWWDKSRTLGEAIDLYMTNLECKADSAMLNSSSSRVCNFQEQRGKL
jgi:hypothetical protein